MTGRRQVEAVRGFDGVMYIRVNGCGGGGKWEWENATRSFEMNFQIRYMEVAATFRH